MTNQLHFSCSINAFNLFNIITIINLLLEPTLLQNLICNPGFDGYNFISQLYAEQYCMAPSNISCWYNNDNVNLPFQVKNKTNPPVGSAAQLVTNTNYTLCQNLVLQPNQTYTLSIDVVNTQEMYWSKIFVKIGSVLICTVYTQNKLTINRGFAKFVANCSNCKLCISSKFNFSYNSISAYEGPCVDNITVIKQLPMINSTNTGCLQGLNCTNETIATGSYSTQSNTSNIVFNPDNYSQPNSKNVTQPQSLIQKIKLSNETYIIRIQCRSERPNGFQEILYYCINPQPSVSDFLISLQDQYKIYIQGELQENYQAVSISDTSVMITLYPQRAYDLKSMTVSINDDAAKIIEVKNHIRFLFIVDGNQITFNFLSNDQVKTLEEMKPLAIQVIKFTKNIYSVLRASFFSFFLLDIISFWNLSLMYNFLNIPVIPVFSKYFLQGLINQFYQLSSILKIIEDKIPSLLNFIENIRIIRHQKIMNFSFGYAWFGTFGFSSDFMQNNKEQVLLFFILLLKILIIHSLRKIFQKYFKFPKNIFPKGLSIFHMFLHQVIGLQIFMQISAATQGIDMGFLIKQQKLNSFLQIIAIWLCIVILPIQYFTAINIKIFEKRKLTIQMMSKNINKEQKQIQLIKGQSNKKNNEKFLKKSKLQNYRSAVIQSYITILQYCQYVTIPLLIVLKNTQIFLIVNGLVIGLRVKNFIKYRSMMEIPVVEKIFNFCNLVVWITHHFTYVAFYIINKISEINQLSPTTFESKTTILGFFTFFTVIIGGLLEIINFAFSALIQLVKVIKLIRNKLKNKKNANHQRTKIFLSKIQNKVSKQDNKVIKKGSNNVKNSKKKITIDAKQLASLKTKLWVKDVRDSGQKTKNLAGHSQLHFFRKQFKNLGFSAKFQTDKICHLIV